MAAREDEHALRQALHLGKIVLFGIDIALALAAPHKLVLGVAASLMIVTTAISLSYPLLGRMAINDVTIRYATRKNSYAFFEAAAHHERLLGSPATWSCQATGLWVMGAIETVRGGSVDIVLNEMFCRNSLNERCHITGMPVFTATPMTETPVLLTTSLVAHDAGTTPSTAQIGRAHV